MNERDMLKHKIFFDRTSKELEIRELEKDLSKLKDDLSKEQRIAKDKVAKLDEVFLFSFYMSFFIKTIKINTKRNFQ